MARPKKATTQTIKTENAETKTPEVKDTESIPKTMKIKMLATYISVGLCLYAGKEYEIDSNLAMKFLKNGECKKC